MAALPTHQVTVRTRITHRKGLRHKIMATVRSANPEYISSFFAGFAEKT